MREEKLLVELRAGWILVVQKLIKGDGEGFLERPSRRRGAHRHHPGQRLELLIQLRFGVGGLRAGGKGARNRLWFGVGRWRAAGEGGQGKNGQKQAEMFHTLWVLSAPKLGPGGGLVNLLSCRRGAPSSSRSLDPAKIMIK